VTTAIAPSGQFVQSLARGLAVIRALSGYEPMSLSDIGRATELSRATARRLLLTLEQLGYVQRFGSRFALTPRVLELGFAYFSALGLPDVAARHLEKLVELVGESSSVSVLDGESVVYVVRVPTRRIMNVSISVGTRLPAYATSMGRVLLAGLDEATLRDLLDRIALKPLARDTIATRAELEDELAKVRANGYAIVDQELESGLRSVAAPIHDRRGRVIAAVNLAVHASRVSVADIHARLLAPLIETATAIESDLVVSGSIALAG
jgi:IclR family pca regulon transcriptional regulator